ncbi:MAG: DUF3742 family protein [Gammaproteobacteria bacterium]|nr:MAG: DUF3742 family protein [Gammaproteobacteria bacterium]
MKAVVHTTFAERLGRMLGQTWRGCVRLDRRANGWLVAQGWTPNVAKVVLAVIKLTALGILLYVAFWLALLIGGILAAAWIARQDNTEGDSDFLGRKAEERDHREGLFYHPTMHNDDPDPRFEDD